MIDWDIIKAEYLTTDTSYRKLADKYNVNITTIAKKAKKDQWQTEKANESQKMQTKMKEIAIEKQTDDFKNLININERLIKVVERKINEFEKTSDDEMAMINVKSIKGLSDTINTLTANVRNLKGIPTQAEKEAQRIAAGRLEIERKKLDGDEEDAKFEFVVDKKEYAE